MAVTKAANDSIFEKTASVCAAAEKARRDAVSTAGLASFENVIESEPQKKPERVIEAKGTSVRLWEDQKDLLFELRYRTRNAFTCGELIRTAIDEYIVNHGSEIGANPEEIEAIAIVGNISTV